VAIVGGLSAHGGAVAGGVAALIAAAVLTPSESVSAAQIASMAAGYGFVAALGGSVLGIVVAFGALRRVPLGRMLLCTNLGLAAGLTASWLGGPWAWHNMGLLACVGFAAGASVSGLFSHRSPAPSSSLPFDAVPVRGEVATEPYGLARMLTARLRIVAPTDDTVDRVPRDASPEQSQPTRGLNSRDDG
jgi:hypothetical protein